MLLITPSKDIRRKIEEDLYQDSETTAKDIKYLREWIAKNPHLPQEHDDIWLERFLYGCRYSVERCKKVLDLHYTQRTNLSQYFQNVDPISAQIRQISNVYYSIILSQCTPEGYRVVIKGLLDYDVSNFDIMSIGQREMLFINCFLRMESNYGVISAIDMSGSTIHHVMKALPYFQHIVMLLQFHVHTDNLESFYEFVPREILPNELGGEVGTVREINNSWISQVESMRDWILDEYKKKLMKQNVLRSVLQMNYLESMEVSRR